jgi:hypothetical protein
LKPASETLASFQKRRALRSRLFRKELLNGNIFGRFPNR